MKNNLKMKTIQTLARVGSLFFGISHLFAIGMFWHTFTLDYKILMFGITTSLIIIPLLPRKLMVKYININNLAVIYTVCSIVIVIIMMIIDLFRDLGPDIGGFILRGIVLICLIIMFNEIRLLKGTKIIIG